MERGMNVATYLLIGLILAMGLVFVASAAGAILDGTGALDRIDARIEVERANAQARKAEADADVLRAKAEESLAEANAQAWISQAQVEQTKAEADYLLHEAAAVAVKQNTRLVRWYAVRGDVRYVVSLLCGVLPLAIGCGIATGTAAWNLYERRNGKGEDTKIR